MPSFSKTRAASVRGTVTSRSATWTRISLRDTASAARIAATICSSSRDFRNAPGSTFSPSPAARGAAPAKGATAARETAPSERAPAARRASSAPRAAAPVAAVAPPAPASVGPPGVGVARAPSGEPEEQDDEQEDDQEGDGRDAVALLLRRRLVLPAGGGDDAVDAGLEAAGPVPRAEARPDLLVEDPRGQDVGQRPSSP